MGVIKPAWIPWLALPLIALGAYFLINKNTDRVDNCQSQTETIKEEKIIYPYGLRLESVKIDGCEYWYGRNGGIDSTVLTHKGNCSNPIHIYNGEIQ
jgi:hypothetical protein